MSNVLLNRLVGTMVLVALAVIFLPSILDGKKQSNKDLFVEVPARPATKPVIDAEQFPSQRVAENSQRQVEIVADEADDDPKPAAAQQSEAPVETAASAIVDTSLEQETVVDTESDKLLSSAGWVVQLGVFRHKANVRELLNKLEDAGYRAFSRPVKTSTGELTKVFVGPDLEKENLEKAVPHLKELTNLQGRITPFTVK
ncbi:SPOR domain-containing protein [Aestuariibacter halophilus]|uniref:SPOR domain-containing protein n=1 Tax=Fluctibacter halophilus TaxID=226011 RepID=A0ABS8G8B2_9ALTE|nr:SPOR domain-containing protein [Aestuariibacter halophilus]MCC2616775.1 SPOR domain-containing protein [Aestuariibacter halophilus]